MLCKVMCRTKFRLCNGILKNDASVSIPLLFNAKMSDCQWGRWIGTTAGGEEGLHLKKPRNVAFKGLFLKVINLGILTERFPICNCLLMYTSAHIITK